MGNFKALVELFTENQSFLLIFLLALLLLFATAFILVFFVIRPLRRLFERARDVSMVLKPGQARPEPRDEIKFITETFQMLEADLKQKDRMLEELYEQERSRAESLERYTRHLLEHLPGGLLFFDAETVLKLLNPQATALLGVTPEQAGRKAAAIFADRTEGPRWLEWLGQALDEKKTVHEEEILLEGGQWLRVSTSLTSDPQGALLGCTFLFNDVTSFKAMAEQVNRQKNLAAMGEMVAGLAHEIRNPLGALKGFAGLLEKKIPAHDAKKRLAKDILKETDLLSHLVTEFLDFARPEARQGTAVQPSALLEEALQAVQESRKRSKVRLEKLIEKDLPVIQGDPTGLRQVFYNLLINAVEAMPGGGCLTVRAGLAPGGDGIRVDIEDEGRGIPPGDIPKIFIPFYSTKAQGTGLGLSIVHRIVTEHGGKIEAASQKGQGSVFKLFLPLAPGKGDHE